MGSSWINSKDISQEVDRISLQLESKREFSNLDILGKGTYGDVLRAYDINNRKWKAVKVITKKFVKKNELPLWSQLHHKNIVSVEKSRLMLNGTLVVVMPLQFRALDEVIRDERFEMFNESITYIKRWLFDCLKGLEYMHHTGLCHMDLKMDNILINHAGTGMLSDFTFINETRLAYIEGDVGVPPIYAPPEVIKWDCMKIFGVAVDSWAFGMLVIESLTGSCLSQSVTKCEDWLKDVKPILDLILSERMFESLVKTTFLKSHFGKSDVTKSLNFIESFLRFRPNKRLTPTEAMAHTFISNMDSVKVNLQKVFPVEELRDHLKRPGVTIRALVQPPCQQSAQSQQSNPTPKSVLQLTDFKSFGRRSGKCYEIHKMKDNPIREKHRIARLCRRLFRSSNFKDPIFPTSRRRAIEMMKLESTAICLRKYSKSAKENTGSLYNQREELEICGKISAYTTVIVTGFSLVRDIFYIFAGIMGYVL